MFLSSEEVLEDLDVDDKKFIYLCDTLGTEREDYYEAIDLIEDVRIGEIRKAMISLGMI